MASASDLEFVPVTIANGTAVSAKVPLGVKGLVGIAMPAAWTAANLTFRVSIDDGVTWLDLYNDAGTEIAVTVTTSRFYAFSSLPGFALRGFNAIQVRSGTGSAPVNQGADRIVNLAIRTEAS